VLAGALPARAQDASAAAKKRAPAANPAAQTATQPAASVKPAKTRAVKSAAAAKAALTGIKQSYESMPAAERAAIQSDLAWTGDYNGVVDGEFGDRAIAAVKAFQKRNRST